MLLRQEAVLLADDMGLGKTVQAIVAMRFLFERGVLRNALVVAPPGLLLQWRRELLAWAPELTAIRVEGSPDERAWKWAAEKHVHLIGYDALRNDAGRADRHAWDLIVLDEAQRIKNRNAQISRVCKRLRRHRSWALTGTPLENHEDELASVLEFVRPNPNQERLGTIHPGLRMRLLHEDVQLRRRKQDVLTDLPPRTVVRVPLELTVDQRRAYAALEAAGRERLVDLGARATAINVLELISRLKQVCNFCPDTGRSAKMQDLVPRLETLTASGHRALVFSQWVDPRFGVERLARDLARFRPVVYTGALSGPERSARIDEFRADPQRGLLLLSLRAGGTGLNLQEASYVVHFDRWWNPAVENQATDRAHRIGQRRAVTVYAYTCVDTIEERIEQILDRKRALFAALVDDVSLDVRRMLTADELFGLFDLQAPVATKLASRHTMRELRERVVRLLERMGWRVDVLRATDVLEARRFDDLGREVSLRVRLVDRWDPSYTPPEDADEHHLVVCAEGLEAGAESGVAVWDPETLRRLEEAAS